ncbi:MAG TPA: hypothetical protein VKB69_11650 [Micromonosporaceae bacterium]|nr:hypothetical protein [Micromonosporaceae bacterium]
MSRNLLMAILTVIDEYLDGQRDVVALRADLSGNANALDSGYRDLATAIDNLDGDIEMARFAPGPDGQRQLTWKLESVREAVAAALRDESGGDGP